MKEKIINVLKCIFTILVFFTIGKLISLGFNYFGIDVSNIDYKDYGFLEALIELIMATIIFIIYQNYLKKDYDDFKNNYNNYMKDMFKFFAIFFALKIFSALLTSVVGLIIGENIGESENQNTIILISKAAPIMTLLSTAILAPIVEEGIFRLSIRKVISNKYLFILLSGLIFGFMHIFPTDLSISVALTYSITYVTMGIYLAYVYTETDNIWICIMLHALNNLLSMLAIMFLA